ncbi:MAG: PAS domain-containing sensor histidine kinase [Prolixibacteraceae bacterium]|jgi:PAS domain S-box-containing protein|nr:PAS domain-containing sensor histidine kinase [Prolixibacteraceae bacterium]
MSAESVTFKKLQQEVVERNQQLDLIFNSLPQSLALVTPDFEILRVNKLFLSLYGVKNEVVIGKRCHEACFGLESVCDGCLVEKALQSKKTEKRIKSFPTGEICEMTAQPVLNELGEVTHILDMRTNISELIEKEDELKRIQFAMNQSTDEFWLFDKSWNVAYASASASKNLGLSISELKGAHIEKFNLLHRLENLHILFEKLKKKKNIRIESIQYKRDGSTYPCEMNLSYFDDQGEFIYAVVRNISKQKKYENELIDTREKAEKASKLKSVFLANMSHEIRTPMNAIIGFSNFVLEEDLDDETKKELKSEIKENSNYLLSIISDIMEISQIESGNRVSNTTGFNAKDLLGNIYLEHSRSLKPELRLNLHVDLGESNAVLKSDKSLIKQIIERLLSNAIKYTSSGEIEFGCNYNFKKNAYDFYVQDSGIGIDFQYHDEIFEPFHQLNSMIKGVGIGLSICKEHAQLVNTKIKVESSLGKGARFSFRIK